ncbi:MAG: hypothetical protein DDT32_01709 [Syntrophomonadaceae bacterium]|nr:hypothetical protein [Bacillota bacterium]
MQKTQKGDSKATRILSRVFWYEMPVLTGTAVHRGHAAVVTFVNNTSVRCYSARS